MTEIRIHARSNRRRFARLSLAMAFLLGTAAHAEGLSVGVGGGVDHGRVDCVDAFACDHGSTHAKLFAGYRVGDALDLQVVYFDAGRFKGGDTTPLGTPFGGEFRVRGVGLTAGYRWTFAPSWSVSARGGVASSRTRFDDASPFDGSTSQNTTQPLFGAGIGYDIAPHWRVGLDYDVTRFKVYRTHGSLQMLGAAVQSTF